MEDVLLACHKCGKLRNVNLNEAKAFNNENPYKCFDCQTLFNEKPNEPEQTRVGQIQSIENQEWETDSSPLGNITHPKVMPETNTPRIFTPEDYNPQAEYARQKMEEFRQRREQIDRDLQRERERIATYDNHRPPIITMLIPIFVMIPVMIMILSSVSSVTSSSSASSDCSTLPGNAGIHQTISNATSWAKECIVKKNNLSNSISLVMVILIVVVAVAILFVVRLL